MWPTVIEKDERNIERSYDLPSRLLKERIILLNEAINDLSAASIVAQLLFLNSEDPNKEILMYINSPGGSITSGLAIYDTMNNISAPVHTICIGMAASMAAFLLCSGAAGHRYCMPNATVMIHQPLGGAQGQATDIEIVAKRIMSLKKKMYTIMAQNTGKTYQEIWDNCERDNYLSAQEALDFGLIDVIPESVPQTLRK